jgi:ABC-type taurine transport system substrate-binding protein
MNKAKAAQYKSPADLKGMKIGVTAPGSSTNMFVNVLLAKAALKPDDVSIIGVGATAGAVAIMKRGEIDAMSNLDPVVSMLESGEPRMRSIEIIWALFATGGADAFKAWSTATLPGPLPEGVATLLSWPAWAVLGVTGVLLAILFRQRDDVYD